MKVSVVVPVWNPGPNLQRCLDSVLNQTMAPDEYELVLVDDGSTDGTAARLDAVATEQGDRVQVVHIPNSGWPGRPRNVGVGVARGEYVQFVDNDDVLASDALAALYELGAGSEADIVIGKLSSDFRGVNHTVFRQTVVRRTLADFPLVETLTPHKMFRREFLDRHQIRYPEGPAHLEDQLYVMRAYAKANSVAVLADRPCYFYLRRIGSGHNAGDTALVPGEYYSALRQVLEVIAADVPAGPVRDRLYRRFYRVEVLGRFSGPAMLGYDDAYRRGLAANAQRIIATYFDPAVHTGSGAATRVQGRLLMDNDLDALLALAGQYRTITLRARSLGPRWSGGRLLIDVSAALYWGEEPLRCERVGSAWALPSALAPTVPESERLLEDAVEAADVELSLVSRVNSASFGRTEGLRVRVDELGAVRVEGGVAIDPATSAGGRPMTAGLWDTRLRLRFAGWSLGSALRPGVAGREKRAPAPPLIGSGGTTIIPYWTRPNPGLAFDVDQWARSLAEALAPSAVLQAAGPHSVRVDLPLEIVPGAPLPPLELSLEPDAGTKGGVLAGDGVLRAQDAGATATVRFPRPTAGGTWRVWLRLAEPGAGASTRLPWQVRRVGHRLQVDRVEPTG